jgi:DNA-binding transcriptional MerR regulator
MAAIVHVELRFKSMDISEAAARTGLAPSALRFYERRGLIRSTGRDGGKRTFDDSIVEQVALVDFFQQCGLTIAEIAQIVDPSGHVAPGWRDVARARLRSIEEQVEFLERAKVLLEHALRCKHGDLDTCPVFRSGIEAHAETLAVRSRA